MTSHQSECIRNPKLLGELITVHRCTFGASFALSEQSVEQMSKNELKPENSIFPYVLAEHEEDKEPVKS